jgi:nicotinate-nucleotide adenylyltransferase
MKTVVFGGRFDPPHLGHLKIVKMLAAMEETHEVWVLPCGLSPQKSIIASSEDRLKLLQKQFGPLEKVRIETFELEQSGPSYTVDTLKALRLQTSLPLVFVMGSDQWFQFESWQAFPDILDLADWWILEREPFDQVQAEKTLKRWQEAGYLDRLKEAGKVIKSLQCDAGSISSSGIRDGSLSDGLLPEVQAYLVERGLYGRSSLCGGKDGEPK